MSKHVLLLGATVVLFSCSRSNKGMGQLAESIAVGEMQSTIEFLSSDLLEGRAPGTRGGMLAEEYTQSIFKLLGIEPYDGNYFQPFTLKGYTLEDLRMLMGGKSIGFRDDVVGSYTRDEDLFSFDGELVFAGYGIVSEDWEWDDYKDLDLRDKILLVRVNEPGRENPDLFEGPALTYYGRWTYKIEEAVRHGAKGILLIHTTETAGYGWHVVQNSWGGEEVYLASSLENSLLFRGWIQEERIREILDSRGIDLVELYGKSERKDFKPLPLGIRVHAKGTNRHRSFETRNVVGLIPGKHPEYKKRAILLSAHIDHLGMNTSADDAIFNGAIDNGSAVSAMIGSAKILKQCQDQLDFSVILLACQAEESGLLGSLYFANQIVPEDVIANINFESTPVWEAAEDIMAVGGKYSTLEDLLKEIIQEEGLRYSEFSMSDQGFFYRSDQFSFARKGIPSIWISAGESYPGNVNRLRDFFLGDYHTVNDAYDPEWPLESLRQTIKMTVLLIDRINKNKPDLSWKGRMTFPIDR